MAIERKQRGERATFDRATGQVHGSGSGAGGGAPGEDYDDDPMAGGGADPVGTPRTRKDEEDRARGAPA